MSAFRRQYGRESVIVDTIRTPIGRAKKGRLADVRPDDLGAFVLRSLLDRIGDGAELTIDEVICGCGYPWGEQGYNVGRTIALLTRLTRDTPAFTITRLCASSLQAIRSAQHAIVAGEGTSYAIVGIESCSRVGRDRHLSEPNPLLDPSLSGPTITDIYMSMIQTAENVATRYNVTRRDMDLFALNSQIRAVSASESGVLEREIIPVPLPDGSEFDQDEGPRVGTSMEVLSALPAILPESGGRITAGNSCALNDGAVSMLVMELSASESLGVTPRARIVSSGIAAVEPAYMGVGPIDAIGRALAGAGLSLSDMDTIEINEAFASQVIAVSRAVGLDPSDERLNPHGGAIALGHPFGMSGARLVTSAINTLEECDGQFAMVALCVGGGQGQAMIIERI